MATVVLIKPMLVNIEGLTLIKWAILENLIKTENVDMLVVQETHHAVLNRETMINEMKIMIDKPQSKYKFSPKIILTSKEQHESRS